MAERVLILGIGNPLVADEGIGVRVAGFLMEAYEFPGEVEVVDAGTMGLGMINLFKGVDLLIVVDAIDDSGHEPGTVVMLAPEDMAPNQVMHSLHDMRLVNVLEAAELTDIRPEAICVGIQVATMEPWVTELSPPVDAALPAAVGTVLDILAERGIVPTPAEDHSVDAGILEAIRTRAKMPDA